MPRNPDSPVQGSVDDPEFRRRRAIHAGRAAHSPDAIIRRLAASADSLTDEQRAQLRDLLDDTDGPT